MPELTRDDGVEIHWEERGEGPLIVISPHANSHPSVFEPLIGELERDHRVVIYDARGYGRSTRRGPHDMETGASDLAAVARAAGAGAIVVSLADACCRAARVAAREPDLVRSVVALGTAPVARAVLLPTDALVSSDTVVNAFLEQLATDYRGAVRSLMTATNPQMTEDELRRRVLAQVEYAPAEAVVERVRAWVNDEPTEYGRAIEDRLWVLTAPDVAGPWFPGGSEFMRLVRPVLGDAHIEEIADGIVSRPDLAADVVRRITAAATAGKDATPK